MTKFIVLEIQNGATLVWAYDVQAEAEAKYYTILSAAALSSVTVHSAVLITNKGHLLMSKCYDRTPAPEPEETETIPEA